MFYVYPIILLSCRQFFLQLNNNLSYSTFWTQFVVKSFLRSNLLTSWILSSSMILCIVILELKKTWTAIHSLYPRECDYPRVFSLRLVGVVFPLHFLFCLKRDLKIFVRCGLGLPSLFSSENASCRNIILYLIRDCGFLLISLNRFHFIQKNWKVVKLKVG